MKIHKTFFILCTISVLAFGLLLETVQLHNPFFGSHLWRQLQTLSTIEAYGIDGINLLKPRTNYVGWPGYLVLEFPIFQAIAAFISNWTGNALLSTRILNIILGCISTLMVYLLTKKWYDKKIALYGALFFALSPLNLFYNRSTLIDISAVLFCLISLLGMTCFFQKRKKIHLISIFIAGTLCVLIKPVFFFPASLYFLYKSLKPFFDGSHETIKGAFQKNWSLIITLLCMSLIFLSWLNLSNSLNSTDVKTLDHLGFSALLKPKLYFLLGYRFFTVILNPLTAFLFLVGGLFLLKYRIHSDAIISLAVIPLYYLCFANINLPHEYYSLILVPFFAMVAGLGATSLEEHFAEKKIAPPYLEKSLIVLTTSLVSVFTFVFLLMSSSLDLDRRMIKISELFKNRVQPMSYSVAYFNSEGNIPPWDYLHGHRTLFLKYLLGKISPEDFKREEFPIPGSAFLYALGQQYGELIVTDKKPTEEEIGKKQAEYQGDLRYVFLYLFKEIPIYPNINGKLIYQDENWQVYEMNRHTAETEPVSRLNGDTTLYGPRYF